MKHLKKNNVIEDEIKQFKCQWGRPDQRGENRPRGSENERATTKAEKNPTMKVVDSRQQIGAVHRLALRSSSFFPFSVVAAAIVALVDASEDS